MHDALDKPAQEALRDSRWDARERWRVIQETIAWAEAQPNVRRNTPAQRRADEARKLERLAHRPPRTGQRPDEA